jgi:starvation-inducible DNA-binding protein
MKADQAPSLGIASEDAAAIAEGLGHLLADTYTLYVTTQGFHWNVTGPTFSSLHARFEVQYMQLRDAADEIAERIRALGKPSPGSLAEFAALTSIKPGPAADDAAAMVARLVAGHEALVRGARPLVELAEKASDVATADLVTARIREHEKTAWMLRSTVG